MQLTSQPLKAVAYLFILGGIISLIDTVVELFIGRINLNLGALYILIGRGLLRLNPRSLSWAMFFTWLGLIFTPIAAVASLFTLSNFQVFGLYVGRAPHGVCFALSTAMFALYYWQYTVLKNREVRQLFFYQTPS